MRLPVLGGGAIDEAEADKMVALAYENGVNYFDTAYGYHGGASETFVGKSLQRFPRDSFCLVSKFPGYEKREVWRPDEVFREQLQKCRTDYFDFYMLHNVYENNIGTYLSKEWAIPEYLLQRKKEGQIRHLGFSTHARTETFMKFLSEWGPSMEFCMIELNALDWTLQEAKDKHEALRARGIPVFVMEPVRGGKLASFSPEDNARLKALRPDESVAAWAFRWLESLPGLGVTLSGMTSLEQLRDNLKTFSDSRPLTEEERGVYEGIVGGLGDMVPCTFCRYCVPECPEKLDIPTFIRLYNDCRVAPSGVARMAVDAMKPSQRPEACVACGSCAEVCPQNIDVPEALRDLTAILDKIPRFVPPRGEDD
jgi:predicted aldo/keto reductase-like oxidoreductase